MTKLFPSIIAIVAILFSRLSTSTSKEILQETERKLDDGDGLFNFNREKRDKRIPLDIVVFEPSFRSNSVTLIIPGRHLDPADYQTTIDLLLSMYQTVVFFPTIADDDEYASSVPFAFDQYIEKAPRIHFEYNLLGHSYGAKIALMVASDYDPLRVVNVIALDPVDMNPPRFTNPYNATTTNINLSLTGLSSDIRMTVTDGGGTIDSNHQADTIIAMNPTLWLHKDFNASHLAYCDPEPGVKGSRMLKFMRRAIFPKQDGDGSALANAHQLIQEHF